MKIFKVLLVVVLGALGRTPSFADQLQSGFSITSPDRPPVWYNASGDKLSQYLNWSDEKGELVLHIAYNHGNSDAFWRDQTWVDSFELSFPMVHLDRLQNRLYFIGDGGRKLTIGHLAPGLNGSHVMLEKGVELSAHRRNGSVNATIRTIGERTR